MTDLPEIIEPTALVTYHEPERVGLARAAEPADMVALATKMADALADIVEKKKLYAVISGKKFPTVEAWATIARMDNVVAREAEKPIRLDDGSYEAVVELVRLSDMAIVGRASALCGAQDDRPWNSRAEHNRRSMAVTRATSRAFRQHYSWIMALAGYEATPAEEMPGTDAGAADVGGATEYLLGIETREGTVKLGGEGSKLEIRTTPDGPTFGFKLETSKGNIPQVVLEGPLAESAIGMAGGDPLSMKGHWAQVKGKVYSVRQPGRATYFRMHVTEIETREWKYPPDEPTVREMDDDKELDALLP